MPVAKKICRVCGKEYEVCRTKHPVDNTFRWQDVSCSPKCGAEYLRLITASRANAESKPEVVAEVTAESGETNAVATKRPRKRKSTPAGADSE